ncbi:hypothetical protein Lbys_3263 [Leadbetterella byssophila DSM 17132]|uniref:Secretion system C-terminal sorting domain-containing protein n=1 Tax=Leadbetterella byssophila (strain DSM 17132 / JCM 16389 / KACC 11308 / NBRC 106382 / 4M15) TaxID=649349 RepID=E4RWI3_LEAB4|nr:T9SS type A sorting domain-containing protein [Leadbetterella byssophila]ADQ18923.1 hypothetical protein Lbys_3263 [Leadbetterella byssophila DSM 17132]
MFRIVLLLGLSFPLFAQESAQGLHIDCPAGDGGAFYINQSLGFRISAKPTSKFIPTYHSVPEGVQQNVEEALAIWEQILISKIPIHIHVYWESMHPRTLASAGADKVYKNFKNAPFKETWYPSALAEAIQGENLTGNGADIILRINSEANWAPPTGTGSIFQYDMVSVVLHEVAHGIGFMSSFSEDEATYVRWGIQNIPFIYDKFMRDEQGNEIANPRFYTNDSQNLLHAITEGDVRFAIEKGQYASNGIMLHTEVPFSSGASLSHFSQAQRLDSDDQLMYPSIRPAVRVRFPGQATLAVLYQIGWALNFYEFDRTYSAESPLFSLYPNPASNLIRIETSEEALPYQIINQQGKILTNGQIQKGESEIPLEFLSSGKYYLKIGNTTLPFIKI